MIRKLIMSVILLLALAVPGWGANWYLDSNAAYMGNGKSSALSYTQTEKITADPGLDANPITTSWGVSGSTVTRENSEHYEGVACAKITIDAIGTDVRIFWPASGTKPIAQTVRYKLTFRAKGTAAFPIIPAYRGTTFHALTDCNLTTSWQQFTYYFTAAADATSPCRLEFGRKSGAAAGYNQSFFIDQVNLEEITGDSAWSHPSEVIGMSSGDTVLITRGSLFRACTMGNQGWTPNITTYIWGINTASLTVSPTGTGEKPIFTRLWDYSPAQGYSWSNAGTPATDIYRLGGVSSPLKMPWGQSASGHPEYNFFLNGGFEDWTGANPDNWTVLAAGASTVTKRDASPLAGTYSADLNSVAGDLAGVKQTVALTVQDAKGNNIRWLLRATHKDGAAATLKLGIKDLTTNKWWATDGSGWGAAEAYREVVNHTTTNDDWIYFTVPAAGNFEIYAITVNGVTTIDELVVMDSRFVNERFMLGKCSTTAWAAQGFKAVRRVLMSITQTAMDLDTWAWDEDTGYLYYRLAAGETIDTVHLEVAQGSSGSSLGGIEITAANNVITGLDVAFAPLYQFYINANGTQISKSIARHGDIGFLVNGTKTGVILKNCIAYDMDEYGYYLQSAAGAVLDNCLANHIKTNKGLFANALITNLTVRNSSASDCYEDCFMVITGGTFSVVTNNAWHGTVSDNWPAGVTDKRNVDPKFVDPINYDFSLQSNSPCINAGIDVGLTTDFVGNPVPNKLGQYSIGAYEYDKWGGGGKTMGMGLGQ